MMGRLGPDALAAGALGANLYFAFLIFGIGVMSAAVAADRERASAATGMPCATCAARCAKGMWAASAISVPMWLVLWHGEAILLVLGQEPRLPARPAATCTRCNGAMLPFLGYLVLRSFIAAMERPRWAWSRRSSARLRQRLRELGADVRPSRLPALGLPGSGIAHHAGHAAAVRRAGGWSLLLDRRFRRYHLFGRFWRPDWARFRDFWRLGLPIGATLAFEVTIFNAAAFLMGLIGADSLAAHAIAIQIASLTFMVPLGFAQAVTVRVGRAYGAGDPEGITPAPAGRRSRSASASWC